MWIVAIHVTLYSWLSRLLNKVSFECTVGGWDTSQTKFASLSGTYTRSIRGHWPFAGEFVSRRSFESIWASDACVYNCLAHSIFNLTSPKSSAGVFAVNDTAKMVDVTVVNSSSDVVYRSHEFGCQRIPSNQVTPSMLAGFSHTPQCHPSLPESAAC